MFSIFKKIKDEKKDFSEISNHDKAILISSLMIECAKSDDSFHEKEVTLIKDILQKKLHLNQDEIKKCFDESLKASNSSVELYSLTKDIRDNFSKEEMLIIFQYLWGIILADGVVDDFEASMMTKLTGLFHLTGKESAEAKSNAENLNNNIRFSDS